MAKKQETKAKPVTKPEILGSTYEPGPAQGTLTWRRKMADRKMMLAYLESGERYWYSKEWFGSESRKKPV